MIVLLFWRFQNSQGITGISGANWQYLAQMVGVGGIGFVVGEK